MIIKYLEYIGLIIKDTQASPTQPFTNSGTVKVAERYLTYLKELDQFQATRTSVIENKNSLMIGQASVVTTIFTLFIPLLIDKRDCVELWLSILLSVCFIIVLLHYLLAIIHALRNLMIQKYPYHARSTSTITKPNRANTELKFLNEEIGDLIYCIGKNSHVNNQKGGNLILSANCFKIANIGFVVFTVIITISAFFIEENPQSVKVENLKDLSFPSGHTKKTFVEKPKHKQYKNPKPKKISNDSVQKVERQINKQNPDPKSALTRKV